MTFDDKKQIILAYMDADIMDLLPHGPTYVPGVGHSPSVKAHADDTFRIIASNWGKPEKSRLVEGMLQQLAAIVNSADTSTKH